MSGRVKRGFFNNDGIWIQYWQPLGDPIEVEVRPDYTAELILALAMLTEKQRFAVECRYGLRGDHEMTVCEIASLMGVSHVSVVKLLQRATRRLRRGLQDSPMGANGWVLEET